MAIFNFKTTEDSTPGGGVIKLPESARSGNTWTLYQNEYPSYNLATMTAANFFKKTTCNSSNSVSLYNSEYHTNYYVYYTGGKAEIQYSYVNGTGTVTISETKRKLKLVKDNYAGSYEEKTTNEAGYNHTMYMSREAIEGVRT